MAIFSILNSPISNNKMVALTARVRIIRGNVVSGLGLFRIRFKMDRVWPIIGLSFTMNFRVQVGFGFESVGSVISGWVGY